MNKMYGKRFGEESKTSSELRMARKRKISLIVSFIVIQPLIIAFMINYVNWFTPVAVQSNPDTTSQPVSSSPDNSGMILQILGVVFLFIILGVILILLSMHISRKINEKREIKEDEIKREMKKEKIQVKKMLESIPKLEDFVQEPKKVIIPDELFGKNLVFKEDDS